MSPSASTSHPGSTLSSSRLAFRERRSPGLAMRLAGVGIAALALAGCGGNALDAAGEVAGVVPAFVLPLDAAVLINTDKTLIDHGASLFTGEDCSTIRAQDGGFYCEEHKPDNTIVETRLFCYRSLGSIECYTEPQPNRQNNRVGPSQHMVGSNALPLDR